MKKAASFLIILAALLFGGHFAYAAGSCPNGTDDECTDSQVCNPDTKQCVAPDSGTEDSTSGIGAACTGDDDCRGNSTECSPTTHTCQYAAAAAGTTNTGAATGATGASTANTSSNFYPLTHIPAVQAITGSENTLPAFFNSLYEYSVGIAAALAFLMIVWAGVTWMSAGDNTEKISQAKKRIQDAIFGLVLILSPAIVFGIINPNVLSLKIDFSQLQPSSTAAPAAPTATGSGIGGATIAPTSKIEATGQVNPGCTYIPNSQVIDPNDAVQAGCCSHQLSDVAQCGVQGKTNQADYSITSYCGCSIKPGISMDYYNYYSATQAPSALYTPPLVGIVPSQKAQHDQLVQECTQAAGKVVDKSTQGLFQSAYVQCPASLNLPTPPAGTTYQCAPMNVSCVSQ